MNSTKMRRHAVRASVHCKAAFKCKFKVKMNTTRKEPPRCMLDGTCNQRVYDYCGRGVKR